MKFSLVYRPDIDGLRTIAVASVVLFHCGFSSLTGGFIGVDIFFVISGFLITTLLCRDINSENFSLTSFYIKRLRRLYPALVVTILLTLISGYFVFMPDEMRELGQSAVGVVAYLSNVFFWLKSDYFDGPSELKPLLHTWSLAVEEQFYILFPLLLLSIYKFCRTVPVYYFVLLIATSFTGCLFVQGIENSAAFYLMPFRAWEFLLGSLCSFYLAQNKETDSYTTRSLPILGIILIFGSIFLLDETYLFPGLSAIPVTLGTALVIAFLHEGTFVYRVLASSPMVFVGKISYSTYLVHWPIVVFYKYTIMREPDFAEKIMMCTLSFLIGFLFYRFIENAFRATTISKKHIRQTVLATAFCSIVIASFGVLTHFKEGFTNRYQLDPASQQKFQSAFSQGANCFLSTEETASLWTGRLCYIGGFDEKKETTLLWGDSHANHLVQGVLAISEQISNNILLFASAGCAPILGESPHNRPNCEENNKLALSIVKEYNVKKIVLASNWQYARSQGVEIENVSRTIQHLLTLNIDISIVGQVPIYSTHNPQYLSIRLSENINFDGNWAMKPSKGFIEREIIKGLSLPKTIKTFDPFETFCTNGKCLIMRNHILMVVDSAHLSVDGSKTLVAHIWADSEQFF